MNQIGWDISHQEFTITDHYYFSKLENLLRKHNSAPVEVSQWQDLNQFKVIVLNYPEKDFSAEEIHDIHRWVREGKRVILTAYYKGEDNVTHIINRVVQPLGIYLNSDILTDNLNCYCGDPLLLITTKHRLTPNTRLLLPCASSIGWDKSAADKIEVLVMSEDSTINQRGEHGPFTLVLSYREGRGELIIAGTCVFWDNFSIDYGSNKELSLKLLLPS